MVTLWLMFASAQRASTQPSSAIALTPDQNKAHREITAFFTTPITVAQSTYLHLLTGGAGSGKTTLTKELIKSARKSGLQVLLVAPTHKARRVLHNIVNTHTFLRTPTTTVASLLGKVRAHSFVGTHNYKKEADSKMGVYDVVFIDEVSMITEEDYLDICKLAQVYRKKVLLIGDEAQIPHPASQYIKDPTGHYLEKAISPAFSLPYVSALTSTKRTSEQSLVALYDAVRRDIGSDVRFTKYADSISNNVLTLTDQADVFSGYIEEQFKRNQATNKVICYTNNAVKRYNTLVRQSLGYGPLQTGEMLMGYTNIGTGGAEFLIENGQDYLVMSVKSVWDHNLCANDKTFEGLSGIMIKIKPYVASGAVTAPAAASSSDTSAGIFLPDLDEENNVAVLSELVSLAQRVNTKGSKPIDYRHYMSLKTQLFFMEHVYQYGEGIYNESNFKTQHPLLFTRMADHVSVGEAGSRSIIKNETTDRITSIYGAILHERLGDTKEISANEELADMYQILEKDFDYGYAITAHKSQGSTYDRVFIDEANFGSLADGWSAVQKLPIRRLGERDRLKYVAVTRARSHVYILNV